MSLDPLILQAIHEKISIVDYDDRWPALFRAERDRLLQLFPAVFGQIEHVGSTSVPGLAAKPIIDIVATVPSMVIADEILPHLCQRDYITSAEFNATLGDRRWLMRQQNGRRTHHLHLVLENAEDWSKKIRFRNILRENSEIRDAYAQLKKKLALEFVTEREAYTDAKSDFIRKALSQLARSTSSVE